ncbi:MAG: thiosulfate oxidation carrier protein SoxY [Hydrogenobacter thermophilus]|uniref:Sulfur oxidation protein n=1 Tax=Hydrogenobacter thermophilus (strain DSM 6534 / IAM 12695 / TK-6) TaxID=608538 RepID=D3DJG2_HYDTT|nr:thiosulfate oxidation carrier protein SoxY [Hydrogenobacter thermophilus]ADO45887.1 thiosulfate-binding protein SoxY [Hydrogenobacter thermophilus TK-6]MCS7284195.1 thiosulfate oxidation carrier protein SoxY [Hydrogenobacter thermophilus]QWK19022.1 MAG: thiosulfate oxidation carrier protein SoxY [Hydrogenobacter thermophilus]BAI69964.1 sulfur oxidation protein [Hydrogenobacter thermophilus TK-6]
MDRRRFLQLSTVSILSLTFAPGLLKQSFGASKLDEELQKRLGVSLSQIKESPEVKLQAPTIAESGANVPVSVESDIPVDKVDSVWIFVDNNPVPWITDIKLSPMNGRVYFATRIKMGQTSNVRAILKMKDGSYLMATKEVKVTVGGCG